MTFPIYGKVKNVPNDQPEIFHNVPSATKIDTQQSSNIFLGQICNTPTYEHAILEDVPSEP